MPNLGGLHILNGTKLLSIAFCVGLFVIPTQAGTLTNISFISNGGSFINNTIVDGTTSPLAFTSTTNLVQPFLNNADSSISLGYGTYYAIAFLGSGAHVGAGTVSFLLDGTQYSQAVTFPNPAAASGNFANFVLPAGDLLTISATGLAADRIRIVADGGGLVPDGTLDAFYRLTYSNASTAVPEPTTGALILVGTAVLVRRKFHN